jgi:signal transduction histidine kinase
VQYRVFEAFYTTKSSGTGMGLSICRSIIAAHGGRLWADKNPSHGAAFRFTLPVEEKKSSDPLGQLGERQIKAPNRLDIV